MRAALAVLLAACGRIGFDPLDAVGDAAADAFDESLCTWSAPTEIPDINTPMFEAEPAMSPDGSRIVYVSDRLGDGVDRLYEASFMGGSTWVPARIVSLDSGAGESGPAWNATGDRLYYSSYLAGPMRLYVVDFDATTGFGVPALVPGLEALGESMSPTVRGDELEMFFTTRLPPHRIEYATRGAIGEAWIPRGDVPELAVAAGNGYPGISRDGLTLYIEQGDPGSFHITRAVRASIDAPFSTPVPVPILDSANRDGDPQPTFDGTRLLLSSDRFGSNDFDLFESMRICP